MINEVWCMASQNPKCGETQEQKARYDANDVKTTQALVERLERRQHQRT